MILISNVHTPGQAEVKKYYGGTNITIEPELRHCWVCKKSDNLIGAESLLTNSGDVTVWYWCEDHKGNFDGEVNSLLETAQDNPSCGYGIKYLS